jgi:hypothetical protein
MSKRTNSNANVSASKRVMKKARVEPLDLAVVNKKKDEGPFFSFFLLS